MKIALQQRIFWAPSIQTFYDCKVLLNCEHQFLHKTSTELFEETFLTIAIQKDLRSMFKKWDNEKRKIRWQNEKD